MVGQKGYMIKGKERSNHMGIYTQCTFRRSKRTVDMVLSLRGYETRKKCLEWEWGHNVISKRGGLGPDLEKRLGVGQGEGGYVEAQGS
jgi:hypothetical protein